MKKNLTKRLFITLLTVSIFLNFYGANGQATRLRSTMIKPQTTSIAETKIAAIKTDSTVDIRNMTRIKELNNKPFDKGSIVKLSSVQISPANSSPDLDIPEGGSVVLTGFDKGTSPQYDRYYEWYLEDMKISGATTKTYNATKAGRYNVSIKYYYHKRFLKEVMSNAVIVTKHPVKPPVSTFSKNDFGNYNPCGVAISNQGKVAISTYEGDQSKGQIFIWNNFSDFNANKACDFQYSNINDPEAVAFDNNGTLFIADTYDGKIFYTNNLSLQPTSYFFINGNANNHANWNPRGMAVDAANNLFVMCENLYTNEVSPSKVLKVVNAAAASPVITIVTGSQQSRENALGIAIQGNNLFATDYYGQRVNRYTISGNALINKTSLTNAGGTLDVVSDGTYAYFTNDGGYLVKWNYTTNNTQNINIGLAPGVAPWGVAIYNNFLIVADAAHKKVQVFDKANAPWQ